MQGRLAGKVAVVTGSTMGIGWEIARRFVAEGARVVVNSRTAERVKQAVQELNTGDTVAGFTGDVSDEHDATALIDCAVTRFGRIDVLVNNAGISTIKPAVDLDVADWQRCLAVNLTGAFLCSRAAARIMRDSAGGAIVNMSSIMGVRGFPHRVAYAASKWGMVGMTETLASEWGGYRIRVNAVAPAFITGPMVEADSAGGDYTQDDIEARTPLARLGSPHEVAAVVLFLASDEASYLTGSTIRVDGGWLAYGGWHDSSSLPSRNA